ncbi:hypothetical protein LJB42_004372 [Komagataella kurtzmanii]|nr:hypothetical protein LJB42_004372 [Komagataella kurtzmanii]
MPFIFRSSEAPADSSNFLSAKSPLPSPEPDDVASLNSVVSNSSVDPLTVVPPITRKHSTSVTSKLKGLFRSSSTSSVNSLPAADKSTPQLAPLSASPPASYHTSVTSRVPASLKRNSSVGSVNGGRHSLSTLETKSDDQVSPLGSPDLKVYSPETDPRTKLKLPVPQTIVENDLDEIMDTVEELKLDPGRKTPPMIRSESNSSTTSQTQHRGRRRLSRIFSRESDSDWDHSAVRSRSPSLIHSPSTSRRSSLSVSLAALDHKPVNVGNKNFKKEGSLITFLDGSKHKHDFIKLKKLPTKSLNVGFFTMLGGAKKGEASSTDACVENSISLLPDEYSKRLIELKSIPENYIWNYEELIEDDENESDSSSAAASSSSSEDEEIDPIITTALSNTIQKLVERISHPASLQANLIEQSDGKQKLYEKYGRIQGLIGKGSYGTVKLCMRSSADPKKPNLIFAVKQLKKRPDETDEHFGKRVTSEFMISSSLTHEAIINTYDLMVDPQSLTYSQVMEFIPCGDLYSYILSTNGEGLPIIEADCFFKQILNALTYIHSVGIAHNDLKVENLLLTAYGQLKIIDFGTATVVKAEWNDEVQLSHGACGSEPYVAPEEYTDQEYDPRYCDIWSLGIIYLAMATGGYCWGIAKESDERYADYLKNRAIYDYTKRSETNPTLPKKIRNGTFPQIEEFAKKSTSFNNRKYVLYNILNPDPETRIKIEAIWRSGWVRNIELCDAGKGLVDCRGLEIYQPQTV